MSARVYSFPGQTEGSWKALFEWKSIDLSYELPFICGGNINYYKSVLHPIPSRENREHPSNFQNKSVSSACNWVSRYILFLGKQKGRGRPFCKKVIHIVILPLRTFGCHKRWKSLSFCEMWNNPTPPLLFSDPLQVSTAGHGVLW